MNYGKKLMGAIVLSALMIPTLAIGQTSSQKVYTAPADVIEKIKAEGMGDRSQVMQLMSYLTDVIGGRLTNSPNMKRANEWTRDKMKSWGMTNAKLESWGPFGRGWSLKAFSAEVRSPQSFPVIAYPKAWSPSTKGTVTADVVFLNIKTEEDLAKYKGTLKDKIVFISPERKLDADFGGFGHRFTDEELQKMAEAPMPAPAGAPRPQGQGAPQMNPQMMERLQRMQLQAKALNMLVEEGAAVLVDNSGNGSGGTLFVSSAAVAQEVPANPMAMFGGGGGATRRLSAYQKEAEARMIPQMTMATEDYNRIVRMIGWGEKPQMTVNIQTQYHDDDLMGYNTVAEIPGTDPSLKEQLVMLGGHLDSWHGSTGATDNAAGCAVMMEAVRILIASGFKPRRTIRVALWSGEEQGLNGSREYVKQQFGEMKPGEPGAPPTLSKAANYDKLSAYYNIDNGTGRVRGVYMQGNPMVAPYFKAWLEPFGAGAKTLTISNTGGTDHLSFDRIGLPGFQFIQDPVEYDTRTHHSNQDNYDRIQAEDMKFNATVLAAFVYQTAMMNEQMPKKPM